MRCKQSALVFFAATSVSLWAAGGYAIDGSSHQRTSAHTPAAAESGPDHTAESATVDRTENSAMQVVMPAPSQRIILYAHPDDDGTVKLNHQPPEDADAAAD